MKFFQVFETLDVDKRLRGLFEDVEVDRVTASKNTDAFDLYITCPKILAKRDIAGMQKKMQYQIFSPSGRTLYIHECFKLSEGNDLDSLWLKLRTYIEDELLDSSIMLANIFRNANISCGHKSLHIELADDFLNHTKEPELTATINDICRNRFGLDISLVYEYRALPERDTEDERRRYDARLINYNKKFEENPEGEEAESPSATEGAETDKKETAASGEEKASSVDQPKEPAGKPSEKPADKPAEKKVGKAFTNKFNSKGAGSAYDKARFGKKKALPEDPDVFYRNNFEGDPIEISSITDEIGEVVVRGQVRKYEDRVTKSGKLMCSFDLTDFTDTISCKVFLDEDEIDKVKENLKAGAFIKMKGQALYDKFSNDVTISKVEGIKTIPSFVKKRKDNAEVKRVELHAHTMMSDMDAVVSATDLVKTAFSWGMRGIAITDHGVAQSFPEASHAIDIKKLKTDEEKDRAKKFKIIYGCEAYLVDDQPESRIDDKGHIWTKGPDGKYSDEDIKKMPYNHIILLCQNDTGRVNLYRLISQSHLKYFNRRPRIPKSLLAEHREGLIIGSACEAGELYHAIVHEKPAEEIRRIADFYDYYEIQPIGNNRYQIESDKFPEVDSDADLRRVNKQIVDLAAADGKLCCATCDVHFLNPEDEVYRRVCMFAKGFPDADRQPPVFLRTTEEMLDEFMYLGEEKAREVVIENPNKIFDMIEKISPVRPDKCPPVIPDSDKTLREICYRTATAQYGDPLPEPVAVRLEHELDSIIKNGFAVMYIIAQKLVWKSNEDGYLVGSRGSVGSSFVANMAGITEVNSLPPHYYCKKCHYSEFDSDTCKEYIAKSGCDMPDKKCPVCGEDLVKDGHNIPFETFLGFNGDKEPDIDLNFSGEYQSKAHDYTEVIFGAGQTFRAGTVGGLADKTAFGYVKKYCEEHEIHRRPAEMERIAHGLEGVKRTTGQHPGGIIVLPFGDEIDSFTPVQHPANDVNSPTVTTHFDYHSIDHNLLKLDILGHDDPTMIRMLEDITGLDAKTIRMDDPGVLSLFYTTDSLGIKPDDIGGCDLGSLGIPELGTNFVMQMLRDTKPKSFSDMVRISGLSHGTDVWLNNTQTLIQEGKCTLSNAICTRDDIMTYLIQKGLDPGHSFKIMESVRKGKGLTPEYEEEMTAHGVPDWYIWSCKKIKYMFPKAHAVAYVMMAFRIAYFKVHYPLAYYAAYFSIRASAFDYETMCLGKAALEDHMKEIKRKGDQATPKEQDMYDDMKLVQEMYARGYSFVPIDIYKAKAHHFQVVDDKHLMPSLASFEGLGDKAADQLYEAAHNGAPFTSREDIKNRAKVNGSVLENMNRLHLLGNIPETDQISLMDLMMLT